MDYIQTKIIKFYYLLNNNNNDVTITIITNNNINVFLQPTITYILCVNKLKVGEFRIISITHGYQFIDLFLICKLWYSKGSTL